MYPGEKEGDLRITDCRNSLGGREQKSFKQGKQLNSNNQKVAFPFYNTHKDRIFSTELISEQTIYTYFFLSLGDTTCVVELGAF